MKKLTKNLLIAAAILFFCATATAQNTILIARDPAHPKIIVPVCDTLPFSQESALYIKAYTPPASDNMKLTQLRGHVEGTCIPSGITLKQTGNTLATAPIVNGTFWFTGLNYMISPGMMEDFTFDITLNTGINGCPAGSNTKVILDNFWTVDIDSGITAMDTVQISGDSIVITACSPGATSSIVLDTVHEFLGGDSIFGTWSGQQPDSIRIYLYDQQYGYMYRSLRAQLVSGTNSFVAVLKDSCNGNSVAPHKGLNAQALGYYSWSWKWSNRLPFQTPKYWTSADISSGVNFASVRITITGISDSVEVWGSFSAYPLLTGGTSYWKDSIKGYYFRDQYTSGYRFYVAAEGLTADRVYTANFWTCIGGMQLNLWQTNQVQVQFQTSPCGNVSEVTSTLDSVRGNYSYIKSQIVVPHGLAFTEFPVKTTVTDGSGALVAIQNFSLVDWSWRQGIFDTITWYSYNYNQCGNYTFNMKVYNPCGGSFDSNPVTFHIENGCTISINNFSITPGQINCGESALVHWDVSGADSVYLLIQQHTNGPGAFLREPTNGTYTTSQVQDSLIVTLIATTSGGSQKVETIIVKANCATGIHGAESGQLSLDIFPNPATTTLHVANLPEGIEEIRIVSVTGQIVTSEILFHELKDLNVSNLTPGIYFLKLGNITKKFVKE